MFTTNTTRQQYATLLPHIRQLGYTATLHSSNDDHAVITLSTFPTIHVYSDGRWQREDGISGNTPADMMDMIRSQRADDVSRHMQTRNLRALALDALHAQGILAQTVRNVRERQGTLLCEIRKKNSDYEPARIRNYEKICRMWRLKLITM